MPVRTTRSATIRTALRGLLHASVQVVEISTKKNRMSWRGAARDPRVAMYWAVDEARADAGGSIAIWAVREGGWQAAVAHNHARSRNQNLLAQDGVTVESWMVDHYYRARGRFPGLEECNGIPAENFRRLVLPHTQVPELRRLLEVSRVTRSRLTPGYYGVVQTVLAGLIP